VVSVRISQAQAQALATFITRIRDDWDHPGIVAAIQKAAPLGTPADIGTALCRLAANPDLRTPAVLADPGTHWANTTVASRTPPVMCPEHVTQPARDCPDCRAQAVTDKVAVSELAAKVRAHYRPTTRPAPKPEPTPADLAAVRERADREATR
jgi:hypothetical protein